MLELNFARAAGGARRVLCLGAHCDDIEIGCGGTLLALQESGDFHIDWAVFSGTQTRRAEARAAMLGLVKRRARGTLSFGDFPDGRFPACYVEIKAFAEELKKTHAPDIVLCHEREDRHQDHRMVNELAWSTFRDQLILEYEIPKWDGGLGQPNIYVPVSAAQARRKVAVLLKAYRTQSSRDWFTAETFMALLRLRGVECRAPSGYAEAFHGRKLRLGAG
ncbi:MAG TPA: PIG-L deacetylase family protein [Steroidobacteraceae bacterium]